MAKILVIEDDYLSRVALERGLRADKHEVFFATNGAEGIEIALKEHMNLFICDWMMPGMDGIAVCKKVKSTDELKTIPIILVSGKISTEDMVTAFDAGADDFLTKPFNIHELKARIRSGLRVNLLLEELKHTNERLSDLNEHLSHSNTHLQIISNQDPLTSLPNRRALNENFPVQLELVCARNENANTFRYLSVFVLDLDHFKEINDTYGHSVGDAVLKIFSRRISSVLKPHSTLYRLAGDEFVCVSLGMNEQQTAEYGDLMRNAISGSLFSIGRKLEVAVATTIGGALISSETKGDLDYKQLIDKADKALYQAKEASRNCFNLDIVK